MTRVGDGLAFSVLGGSWDMGLVVASLQRVCSLPRLVTGCPSNGILRYTYIHLALMGDS